MNQKSEKQSNKLESKDSYLTPQIEVIHIETSQNILAGSSAPLGAEPDDFLDDGIW